MIPAELHKKIKRLEIKASHLVTDILAGEYQSSFKGRGMEFDEVREYQPGDDIRSIDWNVTARTGQPHIKVFKEEREMTLMILVDVSASLFYGSGKRTKLEVAAEIAAIFAYLALRNNDKVGLMLFSDHVEVLIPARKGRGHIWRIIQTVLGHQPHGGRTEFSDSIAHYLKLSKRKNLCVLVSDFFTEEPIEKPLRQLAKRHDLIALQVTDPMEAHGSNAGAVAFQDSESGRIQVLNTANASVRQHLVEEYQRRIELLQQIRGNCGFDLLQLSCQDEVIDALQGLFQKRSLRRGGARR